LIVLVTLSAAEDHPGNVDVELAQALQRITLTQHRWTTEGVQPAAVDVSGLALHVQQATVLRHNALYATFPSAAYVGLFNPLTTGVPEIGKTVLGGNARLCCKIHGHPVTSYVIDTHATWRTTAGSPIAPGCEILPVQIQLLLWPPVTQSGS